MRSKLTLIDPIPCFIPIWTAGISTVHAMEKNRGNNNEVLMNIVEKIVHRDFSNTAACLVGEAHGFDDPYLLGHEAPCDYCGEMCGSPAGTAVRQGGDVLIKFKIKMYNHMVQKHGFEGSKIDLKKIPKIKDMVCQMKLAKKYENILMLMAPNWMKRLGKVNFDKYKITAKYRKILNEDASRCFIGETHCGTEGYYNNLKDDYCGICSHMCEIVPTKFCTNISQQDRKAYLEHIAQHIIDDHADLITKKVQERAHLVFK